MESPTKYRNYIINDPILDYLTLNQNYKSDNLLPGFDEELQLKTYTDKNKKIFVSKIFNYLGTDCIKIGNDCFIMKTKKLKKYFDNYQAYDGNSYSFFTIEYASLSVLKNGNISQSHKYYNFKNWFLNKQSKYKIDFSFVIGRKYTKHKSFNYLANMPYNFDELLEKAEHHLNTIKYKKLGVDIFPNMKNVSDYPWHNAKKIISKEIMELTSIKGISNKDRDKLVSIGFTKYDQIDIKKHENFFHNFNKLSLIEDSSEILFIDFEILTNVYDDFSSFPIANDKDYIFNIGCTNINQTDDRIFVIRDLKDEKAMIVNFIDFLNSKKDITLVHWTNIEKRVLTNKIKQYNLSSIITCDVKWFDLHEYFIKSDIYIENCFNYKLKNVSRCLKNKNLIKSEWGIGSFCDGLGAMTGYIKYLDSLDETILEKIIEYNMIDCKVMEEIYKFIDYNLDIPDC